MTRQRVPARQVRARHDAHTITASQADAAEITQRALTAATVLAPFQPDRMTWIKPSLLWTMDRAGRATKPGQERVPATAIRRDASSGAGPFLPPPPPTRHRRQPRGMAEQPRGCPVRVQGDPARPLRLAPLAPRTIQLGLSGPPLFQPVIIQLRDVTSLAREDLTLVDRGDLTLAQAILPAQRPDQLPAPLRRQTGITHNDQQQ